VDSIELFPAQRVLPIRILRRKRNVVVECGIFYEFVKSDEFYLINPDVTPLERWN
jgi:hypothetical protein